MRKSEKAAILALTAGLMILCLTSCAARLPRRNDIPIILTAPCDSPELSGDTYGDIIRLAYRQRIALAECNARMEAIRNITDTDQESK